MENKEMETVYIATPAGVMQEKLFEVCEVDGCTVFSCAESTLVIGVNGSVFLRTVRPVLGKVEETEDGRNIVVASQQAVQHGNTNFIRPFNNEEEAKVFYQNAKTLLKVQNACKNYLENKNK